MTTEASIIAALPSYLSFAADGTRVLNKEGLRTFVKAQMAAAMGTAYNISQIDGIVNPALDALAATIAPANWAKRSDWPAGNAESMKEANGARAAAVAASFTALRRAAGQVTGAYVALTNDMKQKVKDYAAVLFSGDPTTSGLPVPVTRNVDSRFYVATLVTNWGEESMPSGPSIMVEVDQNDSCTVTRTGTLPTDRGVIASWRLYRSNVGNAGKAFQLVNKDPIPIAQTVYVDTKKSAELQEVLPTTSWMEPPVGLRGMTGMANGIMAGFVDKTLYFSEPYVPYAWPHGPDSLTSYDLAIKHTIVGMASFGSNLFVGTQATPYMVSGTDSASMSAIELSSGQSCVSARSIVAIENGAIYASPDGLCLATFNGVELLTQALFSREDWQALVPSRIQAALHDSVYYFMWTDNEGAGCYALDFAAKKLTRVAMTGSALYSDPLTDTLFVARGNQIISVFGGTRRTGKFKTGIINVAAQQPFAWLQVDSDYTAPVLVKWYGDGALIHTATLTSLAPVRLPPGRYLEHEVEIETTARVTKLTMAGHTSELKQT